METMNDSPHNPTETWDDSEWDVFATWIKGILHSNEVNVTFIKKNGEERAMRCTLQPELLPPIVLLTEDKKPRKEATTSIRVFDLDKRKWRSFTFKSVKRVTFSIGEPEVVPDYNWPFPTRTKP